MVLAKDKESESHILTKFMLHMWPMNFFMENSIFGFFIQDRQEKILGLPLPLLLLHQHLNQLQSQLLNQLQSQLQNRLQNQLQSLLQNPLLNQHLNPRQNLHLSQHLSQSQHLILNLSQLQILLIMEQTTKIKLEQV